jgi:predicted TIM-barrel fold metal-dependent hydrolase
LLGVAYIPFASMEGAVAEIRRTAQRGLRSALIPAVPPSGSWADPTWTPVWEALAELGLPAAFHVGFSFQRGARLELGSQFMTSVVMSKLLMAEPLVELIYSGVLARYPDVKLVAVEGQLGWIPFVIQYMDHIYEKHRYWTGVNLPEKPSVYFRRQVYATFMEDEVGIRERAAIGVDNILWSSDYPHSETTWPNSQKLLAEWLRDVPQPEVDKIVRENARALYHI